MDRSDFFSRLTVPGGIFAGGLSPAQADGTNALLDACDQHKVDDPRWIANILAQVHHETGGNMAPIKETVMPSHRNKNPSDAEVVRRLDRAFATGRLPWVRAPYWREGWFGRGPIQITHRENYQRMGERLGVDLVGNPALALDLQVGADIAVVGMSDGMFTGRRLGQYFGPGADDPRGARRIVNGPDGTESKVADTHARFLDALLSEGATAPAGPPLLSRELIRDVQRKLRDLGYTEVGMIDGKIGSRTRGAILAFRADEGLPLVPDLDDLFIDALVGAISRAVDPARATGKPKESRIIKASDIQVAAGTGGAAISVAAAVTGALDEAEGARETVERLGDAVSGAGLLASVMPWVSLAVFVIVVGAALYARRARIEDHRRGKTL